MSKVPHWMSEDNPWKFAFILGLEHMVRLFGILLYLLSQLIVPVTHFSGFPILCLFHIILLKYPGLPPYSASEAQPDLPC